MATFFTGLFFTDPWRIWASPKRKRRTPLTATYKSNGEWSRFASDFVHVKLLLLWFLMLLLETFLLCLQGSISVGVDATNLCDGYEDSFEGRWDFWLIFYQKLWSLRDITECKCLKYCQFQISSHLWISASLL